MQVRTKEHPIDNLHLLIVSCPGENVARAIEQLKQLGCDVNDCDADAGKEVTYYSPEEVFPERGPHTYLRGLRYREGLTQVEFARQLGISVKRLSLMERGKLELDPAFIEKLGKRFDIVPEVFLEHGTSKRDT